ncbi:MAG: hypothetical protein RLZZ305_1104 [Actinomycetota bacterium]
MTDPLLVFDRLGVTFADGTETLRGIDLSVTQGEFVAVVGPSGCGKSTLLRVASGLQHATDGNVSAPRDSTGYVFQDPTLLPWRTVRANVRLFAELHGMETAECDARVDAALATVGLSEWAHHYPRQLSGGMRMRASLARSLVLRPSLFMFDEPFGAVDEMTRERLNDELQALFAEQGFAGLFVTHSVSEAVFLATRVIVMSARPGRIVADIPVSFPHPRGHDLRYTPEFASVAAEVSSALRQGAP